MTGAAGAMKALREGQCDDGDSGARAAFEQIGPAGRTESDAEALRHEGCRCQPECLDRWGAAGRGARRGWNGGAHVAACVAP